jgi:hypothetical protein
MPQVSRDEHLDVLSVIDKMSKSQLDQVYEVVIARNSQLKQSKTRKLKQILHQGDTVILSTHMKPRYLGEAECTFVKFVGNKAHVKLPNDPAFRRFAGDICVVPISAISKRVRKARG